MASFTVVTVIGSPVMATAAPSAIQGTASWTSFGLGACGWVNNDSEMVVGVSPGYFGSGEKCGTGLLVTGPSGKSVKVKIVDKCSGCSDKDLNLSPAAFEALGAPLEMARIPVSWTPARP